MKFRRELLVFSIVTLFLASKFSNVFQMYDIMTIYFF